MSQLRTTRKFKRASGLSEQIADFLVSEIHKGNLRPGEMLPSEPALSKDLGVSRTVIREAFARLKQDGFLDSKQKVGARIAELEKQRPFRLEDLSNISLAELSHLYELRIILEGNAAALAAKRRKEKDIKAIKEYLGRMDRAVKERKDGTDPDLEFHQIIARATANPYLQDLMRFLNGKLRELIQKAREHSNRRPNLPQLVQQEHVAIYEAISVGNPAKAQAMVLAHLKNAAKRLGINLDQTG
ncbi:MAG: FadR family transcriptional regulator [Deltaproteobacteria bacterium]|nr:FadR family transcriptional regulator [Deltaproteobacteria bacterium]